jgi:hypothetical protein
VVNTFSHAFTSFQLTTWRKSVFVQLTTWKASIAPPSTTQRIPWQRAYPVTGILIALLAGILIAFALAIFDARYYRLIARVNASEVERLQIQGSQARDVANQFLTSCRLLSIHRNGRLNVFTFARGDQIFTVETMGLLSDNPDEWRTMAGLTQ